MGGTAEPALTIYLRQPNSAALDPTPLRVWPTQSVSTPATLEVEWNRCQGHLLVAPESQGLWLIDGAEPLICRQ